jgi:8-oxo-dGTP diphosphatase
MISLLLIAKNKKFLLLKRENGNHIYSSHWGLPGGSVEKNETPIDAIIREIKEEMSLNIKNVTFLKKYPYHNTYINLFIYNPTELNLNDIILNNEHTKWGLYTYYDILNMKNVIPSTIQFINDYCTLPNVKEID